SSMSDDEREINPYERWGIDPLGGPEAITRRMRELAEDAPDEETKKAIRAAWEELTLHPARRLRAALFAHPDSRAGAGAPPPRPKRVSAAPIELALADLVLRPDVLGALDADADELPDVPFDDDPILRD